MALKILLADDSMIAQNLGKKILTDAGHEVVAVSNGAAAVKKLAEVKPQLAILDIYMPGYTGLEVCERIKNSLETANMPVLLTVGKMEPYRPEDGARVHAEGVIIKPFEGSDLVAAVGMLEEKLLQPKLAAEPVAAPAQEVEEDEAGHEEVTSAGPQATPSQDMSLPAFGLDELPVEAPAAPLPTAARGIAASAAAVPMNTAEAPVFTIESAPHESFAADTHVPAFIDFSPVATSPDTQVTAHVDSSAHSTTAEPMAAIASPPIEAGAFAEHAPVTAEPVTFDVPASDGISELEFTAAPAVEVEVQPTMELEPTVLQDAATETSYAIDPALVTDPSEITNFATRFGTDADPEVDAALTTDEVAETEIGPELLDSETATVEAPAIDDLLAELPVAEEVITPLTGEPIESAMPDALLMESAPVQTAAMPDVLSGEDFAELDDFAPSIDEFTSELASPVDSPQVEIADTPAIPAAAEVSPAADDVHWAAAEAAVDENESAASLDEEMQRAFASLEEKLETPLMPVAAEPAAMDEIPAEEQIPAEAIELHSVAAEPIVDTARAPGTSGDPEFGADLESAFASLDPNDLPETLIETQLPATSEPLAEEPFAFASALEPAADFADVLQAEPAITEEAAPVEVEPAVPLETAQVETTAALEEVAPETWLPDAPPQALEEIEAEITRRAAIVEPTVAVVNEAAPAQAAMDETRVAAAVARVMERMKTQIVAEIVKELQSE